MLGEILRTLREQNGLTQQNVATAMDMQRSTYTYYETGRSKPDIGTLTRLAKMYGVTVDFLLGTDKSKKPSVVRSSGTKYEADANAPEFLSELTADEKKLIMMYRQIAEKESVLDSVEETYKRTLLK